MKRSGASVCLAMLIGVAGYGIHGERALINVAPDLAGKLPEIWRHGRSQEAGADVPVIWLEEVDPVQHLQQHGAALGTRASKVYAISPPGFEPLDVREECKWQEVGGGAGWRCRLHLRSLSPARHILTFSVSLPEDGELAVYVPSATSQRSVCAHDCQVVRAGDVPSGRFTVPRLQGDEIAIEYFQRQNPEVGDKGRIVLESVMQGIGSGGLKAAAEAEEGRRARSLMGWQAGTQFDMRATQSTFTSVSECTQLIACNATWNATHARGVVSIYAVNQVLGTVVLCSGAIINGPSTQEIYLLTADHCFSNKSDVNTFEDWVVAFNYKTDSCSPGSVRPPMLQVIQGVGLKFYDLHSDILLVVVMGAIADKFRVYAMGYDARPEYVPKTVVGIHHPDGDAMHISYATGPGAVSTNFTAWRFPAGEAQPTEATHYQVAWTDGVTAGGSSGSPLIDLDTGLVVGVLTGGPSSCGTIGTLTGRDYYGRLNLAMGRGLDHFLSNKPGRNITVGEQIELQDYNQGVIVVNKQRGRELPEHGPGINYFPTHMRLSLDQRNFSITYYLTDPPAEGEVISASISLRGMFPGNLADAHDYIDFNADVPNMTAELFHKVPHQFNASLKDNVTSVPGNILRFMFTMTLTSDQDSSYEQINILPGVIRTRNLRWQEYKPIWCVKAPCSYIYQEIDAEQPASGGMAVFGVNNSAEVRAVTLEVQLQEGAMPGTSLTAYCNGKIAWAATPSILNYATDSYLIKDVLPEPNSSCVLLLHDFRDLDAALPLSLVTNVSTVMGGPGEAFVAGRVAQSAAVGVGQQSATIPLKSDSRPSQAPSSLPSGVPAQAPGPGAKPMRV